MRKMIDLTGQRIGKLFVLENMGKFDGRQHLTGPDTTYWGRTVDTLESIKERDEIKNHFCLNHNYPLIRIPYYKLETITIEDLLRDKYLIKRR